MVDDGHITVSTVCKSPISFQVHKIGAKLLYDRHDLSPYWGLVSCFEPDHDETLDSFDVGDEEWVVEGSTFWQGKLDDPNGNIDGGLYEYSYRVHAVDDTGDRDVAFQFRPALPNAMHVDTGDPIQSLPDDLPEGIRVQIQSTNVGPDFVLEVLQALAEQIGLNPDYFGDDPHEWSRGNALEMYARLDREISERALTGESGLLRDMTKFASTESGRGEYIWNHEQVQAYIERFGSDPETWSMLLPESQYGKKAKSYHPEYVRSDETDPLFHPKFEVAFSPEYNDSTFEWDDFDNVYDELRQTGLNVLHWAGIPVDGHDDRVDDVYQSDSYYSPEVTDDEVTLWSNPLPELLEKTEKHTESELARTNLGHQERAVFQALTDGGPEHYENLANQADAGTSTVYRLVNKLSSLIRSEDGIIQFADRATRDTVSTLVDQLRDTADWASQSLRQIAEEHDLLDEDGPLTQWMQRHGVQLVEQHPDLHFDLGRPVSERQVKQILRAGYQAALGSGMLSSNFLEARFSWPTIDGDRRERYRGFTKQGNEIRILGQEPLDA